MTTKTIRKVVLIDEDKCDGCGVCIPSCAEGALQIINGKAKLISEKFCDGLGACLGECPQDAISVIDQLAEEFDEALVEENLAHQEGHQHHAHEEDTLECGCPSSTVTQFDRPGAVAGGCPSARVTEFGAATAATAAAAPAATRQPSTLGHWPVQMTLVPPTAPFLQGTDLALTADCVPFAYANFHEDFLKDHSLLIACPKLDDAQAHLQKLTAILTESSINSLTVLHMEVPCCFGLVQIAKQAIAASGKNIPFREVTIGVRGDVLD
ncbi:MAG: 4Fe-4S binding protein [Dehalococcoidales bacterium]